MTHKARIGYELAKRVCDICVAGVGVVLISPLLAAIAVLVGLDSPGPVLYKGRRTGMRGVPFNILKFRTMCVGADRAGTTTAKNDARVTRVGRFLRHWKLDELPQLFNVLRGEMSLVGPRPEVEEHTRAYDEHELEILTVRPGITDYSSVHFIDLAAALGDENPHDVFLTTVRAQKNALRLEYVRRRSLMEDIRIIALTASALLRKMARHKPMG
ncbi:MAG: sugar transferase [Gemmatimonadota bacterium]|nr:sugar transferase [Gemmatimonadota bacterium]